MRTMKSFKLKKKYDFSTNVNKHFQNQESKQRIKWKWIKRDEEEGRQEIKYYAAWKHEEKKIYFNISYT